ncbi:hypothetical protein [Pseudomonas aeruginosa]|uniref:hypothetical protein n=1 Tax=Pseudomonas aeruginosa TaxID=287 RepID=UPI003CFEE7EB
MATWSTSWRWRAPQRGDAGIDRLEAGGHVAEQKLAGVGEHDASMNALEQRGRPALSPGV